MLQACDFQFEGNWDVHLSLMKFAYNNSFHSSVGMTPYEALYGRCWRTPMCWDEVGERKSENVISRKKLKTTQDCQKSYTDKRWRDLKFEVGDKVFLKLCPWKGVLHYGRKDKLSARLIGPYEILERIGLAAYNLTMPMELSRICDVFHVRCSVSTFLIHLIFLKHNQFI